MWPNFNWWMSQGCRIRGVRSAHPAAWVTVTQLADGWRTRLAHDLAPFDEMSFLSSKELRWLCCDTRPSGRTKRQTTSTPSWGGAQKAQSLHECLTSFLCYVLNYTTIGRPVRLWAQRSLILHICICPLETAGERGSCHDTERHLRQSRALNVKTFKQKHNGRLKTMQVLGVWVLCVVERDVQNLESIKVDVTDCVVISFTADFLEP